MLRSTELFDVGFQEIVLIGVIALLVIGPERLPAVARSVGLWVGKIQRFVAGVKTDIRNELQNDELRGLLSSQEDQIRELKETLTETRNEFARSANIASNSLTDGMSSAVDQVRDAAKVVKDGATPGSSETGSSETGSSETSSSDAGSSGSESADTINDPKLPAADTPKADQTTGSSDTEPGKPA